MVKIGLLSDTHGFYDEQLNDFFKYCDEIWHAGDIGTYEVVKLIRRHKELKAVYGNIDGGDIRVEFPKHLHFKCEDMRVWITHIGGYPKNYDRSIRDDIKNNPPDIFICGHSHILKVICDKDLQLLHINPGAAGKYGFHNVRTAVRFEIDKKEVKNLEIIELEKRV